MACQRDRKALYRVGKQYDIPEEVYEKNKAYFKKKENKKINKGQI